MTLVGLVITLIIVGVGLFLVNAYLPMEPRIKSLLNILVGVVMAILVIVFLLGLAGVNTGAVNLP